MTVWIVAVVAVAVVVAGLVAFTAWTASRIEKLLPPAGRFVEVDGARIHYLDEGSGPPLLLIHGLSGQMHNFTHGLLAPLRRDFRVVIIDRPGSGYSTRGPRATGVVAQARVIAGFCERIGLKQPLVVGHSLGGAIAVMLAVNHPEQVGGLALVAPATALPDRVPAPFDRLLIRSALVRRVVAWTLATPLAIAGSARTLALLFGPQPVPGDFGVKGGGLLSLRPRSFIGASIDLVAAQAEEPPEQAGDLAVPVGVLFGDSDRILDPAVHGKAFVERVKGAELEVVEGGGHMIPVTSAERTVAFIVAMAKRIGTATAPG